MRRSLLIWMVLGLSVLPAAETWIFVGQSNLSTGGLKKGISQVRAPVDSIEVQRDGRPISYFLPAEDSPRVSDKGAKEAGQGWQKLQQQLASAGPITGLVYYQGESNSGSTAFGRELATYFQRVRELTGQPQLPVVMVQMGPRALPSNKAEDPHQQWATPLTRELQRRLSLQDPRLEVVAAHDLDLVDDRVHLDKPSHQLLGTRVGQAMQILLGAATAGCGPIPLTARRDPENAKAVLLECTRISGSLQLVEGWQSAFSLTSSRLPEDPATWPNGEARLKELPADANALRYPLQAEVVGTDTVRLLFESPIGATDRLSYAGTINSQAGPHPRPVDAANPGSSRGIRGLTDDSGQPAIAAFLLLIAGE